MRSLWWCGLLSVAAMMACLDRSGGGPVEEVKAGEHTIDSFATLAFHHELKAQEVTRIIASGAERNYLGLYVFDGEGNCVAWDDFGGTQAPEDCAVLFVPPAQGVYRVEVRNLSDSPNQVRVVVR